MDRLWSIRARAERYYAAGRVKMETTNSEGPETVAANSMKRSFKKKLLGGSQKPARKAKKGMTHHEWTEAVGAELVSNLNRNVLKERQEDRVRQQE
jgi:hypothetical protein